MNVIINNIKWYCLKTNNGYTSKPRNVQRKPFMEIYKKTQKIKRTIHVFLIKNTNVFGYKLKWEYLKTQKCFQD